MSSSIEPESFTWNQSGNLRLSTRAARSAILELLDHAFQVGIARAKAPREPIPASLRNLLAVRQHLELTCLARRKHRSHAQSFLDEVHETRDLNLVIPSGRAVHNFYFHSGLPSLDSEI